MRVIFLFMFLVMCFSVQARADIFVWQDPASDVSVAYPDRWSRGHNQQADDVLTVHAPYTQGANDFASCRVRVRGDKRFTIYPRSYDPAIQHHALDQKFWADYLGDYRSVEVHAIYNDAGLGRGFASRAEISFVSSAGPKVQKRGFVYATIYNDKLYAVECSADRLAFERWQPSFGVVLDSLRIRSEHHLFVGANYRSFTKGRS